MAAILSVSERIRIWHDQALFKRPWANPTAVAAPMRAGSCSFHNGLTIHGAGPNMTSAWRRAMTCAYMPDGNVFNGEPNMLPEAYLSSLKPGDLLNNNDQNPLIYAAN